MSLFKAITNEWNEDDVWLSFKGHLTDETKAVVVRMI